MLNMDLKKKQESFAIEAQEGVDDITKLRKQLNETNIDLDLQFQYTKSRIKGVLSTTERLHLIEQAEIQKKINSLKDDFKVEKEVSEKIIAFTNKRREQIQEVSDKRDKLRETEINKLLEERQVLTTKKEEADEQIDVIRAKCQEEEEVRILHLQKEQEDAAAEAAKVQNKLDMIAAAKYIEKKWNWYQTEGKFLKKKKKGGKGKGKKKK